MKHFNNLNALYLKIKNFFNQAHEKYPSHMQCKLGCAQCCHVDLTVFSLEAQNIENWFKALPKSERIKLQNLWDKAQVQGVNLNNQKASPCVFLYEGVCSIYDARPGICRTHGLMMLRKTVEVVSAECCPLNFTELTPDKNSILDISTIDLIMASLQNEFDPKKERALRVSLHELKDKLMSHDENI